MDPVLRHPVRDELGLPILPPGSLQDEPSEDDMKAFMAGDFSSFGLPMPSSMPTAAEVQREARERSTHVLASWNQLRQILERHEDTIRKRWMKKTKTQRTTIVLGTWPKMSATHRPDYEALRKEGGDFKSHKTKFREAYLWPYMNVEDLVKGKTMLLFLNARGRHPPYMFAHADFQATRIGRVSGFTMSAFLNLHTMFLDGLDVSSYGRLVSWDDDEEAMMRCMRGLAHQPGEGLWILEIQQSVLKFLVGCCHKVLHDFEPNGLIQDAAVKPEPPPIGDSSEWPSLAAMAAEAPYRLPAQLDFSRLKALVAARMLSAEDHVRSLREDPGYFADSVGDWSEHRQERLPDTNGAQHPVLHTPLFWERVVGNVLLNAYLSLIQWDIVDGQLTELIALQKKYSNVIKPENELPPTYMKALVTFRYILDQIMKGPIANLQHGFVASPPLRSDFVREPHIQGSTMIRVQNRSSVTGEIREMMWLLENLWTEQKLQLTGACGLMDEIEHLIESNPKQKAKISSWIAQQLAELGLAARLKQELDLYQPWAAGYDAAWADSSKEVQAEFSLRFDKFATVNRILKDAPLQRKLSSLGSLTESRFFYPSDKRRTKETTDDMRKAEHNLDAFWNAIDQYYESKTRESLDDVIRKWQTGRRSLERTPEWIEPVKAPKNLPSGQDSIYRSLPSLRIEDDDVPKFVPSAPKVKPKTRGSALESQDTVQDIQSTKRDIQPIFKVKNRAFKVFRVLFFNPASVDLPGEIHWADFLFAMASTGFSPEKLYGSVWQFTPSGLDVERSIQFHEPHPVAKIPFRNARRIGRRLSRAYGWNGGMFVLE